MRLTTATVLRRPARHADTGARATTVRAVRFRASDVAAATGGRLVGADVELDGASFDSRALAAGNLFVPIVAARDGHAFIAAAAAAGAPATLTAEGPDRATAAGIAAIEVADTSAALMDLAAWAVRRLDAIVVGITGSVGKTSTKDLAAAAMAAGRRVVANDRSYNNEQGLPVTVLGARGDTEVLVLEMGMRGFGEIARLCAVAPPQVGVVTAVAAAHTERLGGIDGVARAKAELIAALPADGVAVLNGDDHRVAAMASLTSARAITFGHAPTAEVAIERLVLDELARASFRLRTPWGRVELHLGASGRHMAANAAAAIAAAGAIGVDVAAAADAVSGAQLSASRMAVHRLASGAVVIDDAYNANPTSMAAAFDALAAMPAGRRVAIVGEMAELDDPAPAHRAIAQRAAELGIELVAVGTDLYGTEPCADAVAAVEPLDAGTAVLVKASRVAALDRVAARLLAGPAAGSASSEPPLP
jgi:UDP-N-acetylmuramoyl-tripeptide--D-alanyl-D-alanine ligase